MQTIPDCVSAKPKLKKQAQENLEHVKDLGNNKEGFLSYSFKQHSIVINPECFCPDCTRCSCSLFVDSAICYHLMSCCLFDKFDYPGLISKKFVTKSSSKKRKAGKWYEKD